MNGKTLGEKKAMITNCSQGVAVANRLVKKSAGLLINDSLMLKALLDKIELTSVWALQQSMPLALGPSIDISEYQHGTGFANNV
mmetsp:Transcript_1676/g.3593  ORF Transcript_1676/g.3593 Transcript_1676/m.3593 type:complete len:84 (-) Transcript_1676:2112-2363(-)